MQVDNNGGGKSYKISHLELVLRYFVLGSTQTIYQSHWKVEDVIMGDLKIVARESGDLLLRELIKFNDGRAPKQEPLIVALAMCMVHGSSSIKDAACAIVPAVCRTPTHLFFLASSLEKIGKTCTPPTTFWGPRNRKAFSAWYTSQDATKLAYKVTKYWSRNGWTHRDIFRLCHPHPPADQKWLFTFIAHGRKDTITDEKNDSAKHLVALAQKMLTPECTNEEAIAGIKDMGLAREHIRTEMLRDPNVWEALLTAGKGMPTTAMIRNLGVMTSAGLFDIASPLEHVLSVLNAVHTVHPRIHPYTLLLAWEVYTSGGGIRGNKQWVPNDYISSALETAFYASFSAVVPTGKRFMLAMDVSGSMGASFMGNGSPMTCATAAAAMCLVTSKTESKCTVVAFSSVLTPVKVTASDGLESLQAKLAKIRMGATDCSLPMVYALKNSLPIDVFIVYTDSETNWNEIPPAQALRDYREKMGMPGAKMVVVAMSGTQFSLADPNDPGMLDVIGFDSSAPEIISQFVRGFGTLSTCEQ